MLIKDPEDSGAVVNTKDYIAKFKCNPLWISDPIYCIRTFLIVCPSFSIFQSLQTENDALKKTLDKVQSQLDTSLDAQDQQRKVNSTTLLKDPINLFILEDSHQKYREGIIRKRIREWTLAWN